jgi:hypothetical protein
VGGIWAGYLPTIRAAVEGGYGADYNTTVEVGTGEMLVDRSVVKNLRTARAVEGSAGKVLMPKTILLALSLGVVVRSKNSICLNSLVVAG